MLNWFKFSVLVTVEHIKHYQHMKTLKARQFFRFSELQLFSRCTKFRAAALSGHSPRPTADSPRVHQSASLRENFRRCMRHSWWPLRGQRRRVWAIQVGGGFWKKFGVCSSLQAHHLAFYIRSFRFSGRPPSRVDIQHNH